MTSAPVRCSTVALRLSAAAALLAGCVAVTINVTFPQEQIDSAASSIEDVVRTPTPPAGPTPAPPRSDRAAPRASHLAAGPNWLSWAGPSPAEAQVPELRTRTPEVTQVIDARRARYPQLSAALVQGCLGENNQGLVEVRPGPGCPGTVAALAADENRDRMVLYRTLVQQNNMPPGDLVRVQAGFAKAHRDRAPAGAWVQDDGGRWSRK
jgi:uncharacterized protein YdbL (DUF1318 family)